MDLLIKFDGDKSKINACKIKEQRESLADQTYWEFVLESAEIYLPTRVSDETYLGILNITRATFSNGEIEKALVS